MMEAIEKYIEKAVNASKERHTFARAKLDEGEMNLLDQTNNAAQAGLIGSKSKCDS